jgi:hypothetical protein
MKHSTNRQNVFGIIVISLLLAMAIPATALGQGRGKGHGQGNIGNIGWPTRTRHWSNHDKKCAKFKNCHDASGGRWDGRGPRDSNILGRRLRHRNHRFDNNDLVWRNRGRRVGRRVIDNR